MEKITNTEVELMSLDARRQIIKDLKQKDMMDIFDGLKPNYEPIVRKRSPLDQQISLGITKDEKIAIADEVKRLKRAGETVTISSLVRSRATGEIDIETWRERAEIGIRELNSLRWDKEAIDKELRTLYSRFDSSEDDDDETRLVVKGKINELEAMLEELKRPTLRRGSRMSGRVTFNEANIIRWRAARLTLTVADYMRFLVFGYVPFTEQDRHLSIIARKRFYVAVLDVVENGWGDVPHIEECENCARYADENKELKAKLERLRQLSK